MIRGFSRRSALKRLAALPLGVAGLVVANDASVLHALPRHALVVGNSGYKSLPVLRNAGNDARAFAKQAAAVGFEVAARIDADKRQLEDDIAAFCKKLAQVKGVGLFYFAGHGLQLNWHNYLIPVDAAFEGIDDVPHRSVGVIALVKGLKVAANAMNVVILDACRDNPFVLAPKAGKGLSQMDAPAGTLLAYATAPGNTASDGEGENGLYTQFLLQEMAKPESKIEDVFKRVRLNVRRASKGAQVPWESTSLEDDFYFVPPPILRKASQEELDRQFAAERQVWERVEAKVAAAERTLQPQ